MKSDQKPPLGKATSHVLTDELLKTINARYNNGASRSSPPARNRRTAPRVNYLHPDLTVRVTQPSGGSSRTCTMGALDISTGGVCLVYAGFLHNGTMLDITLKRNLSGEQQASGRVVWCKHVMGTWHVVGAKFNESISLASLVNREELEQLSVGTATVQPAELSGTVLILDDQEMDQELFAHMLRATKMHVVRAQTIAEATSAIKNNLFDAAFVDLHLGVGEPEAEQTMAMLRDAGCAAPIVATSVDLEARRKAAKFDGVEFTLQKPIDSARLFSVLGTILNSGSAGGQGPIYSTLPGAQDQSTADLLDHYIKQAHATAAEIQRLVKAGDLTGVRLRCQTLRGTGAGYGFEPLTDAAGDVVKAMDAAGSLEDAEEEFRALSSVCRRLAIPKKAAAPEAAK